MRVRLAACAYALPEASEDVASVLSRERDRVGAALRAVTPGLRRRVEANLGVARVRVCPPVEDPYHLARRAAVEALGKAGLPTGRVDLLVDYSTLPGAGAGYAPLAHRLATDLGLEASLNLNLKFSGCAAFHLAVKLATSLMRADQRLRVALLVAADTPPPGSRSLMPITVQGDAGSAVVLSSDASGSAPAWPEIVGTEVLTLGGLHDLVVMGVDRGGRPTLHVDARRLEESVVPVYYLHFERLVERVLGDAGIARTDVDRVVYSNVSAGDRDGFARCLRFDPSRVYTPGLVECGHTFASDLALNYARLLETGVIGPGEWILFAAAGIGFTWGVTLARS